MMLAEEGAERTLGGAGGEAMFGRTVAPPAGGSGGGGARDTAQRSVVDGHTINVSEIDVQVGPAAVAGVSGTESEEGTASVRGMIEESATDGAEGATISKGEKKTSRVGDSDKQLQDKGLVAQVDGGEAATLVQAGEVSVDVLCEDMHRRAKGGGETGDAAEEAALFQGCGYENSAKSTTAAMAPCPGPTRRSAASQLEGDAGAFPAPQPHCPAAHAHPELPRPPPTSPLTEMDLLYYI